MSSPLPAVALALVFGVLACGHDDRGKATTAQAKAAVTTAIRGTVHGHDGAVPALAHARIVDPRTHDQTEVVVGSDGRFALESPVVGFAVLELTAVDHAQLRIPVVLDGAPLELDVVLGTYVAGDAGLPVSVMSWAGDPDESAPTITAMTRDAGGRLVADIATDAKQLRLQLTNFAGEGRSVDVPGAKHYEYDSGGDYRSIVDAVGGKVHLEIAPGSAPAGVAPKLSFAKPGSTAAAVAALGRHWPIGPTTTEADAVALWTAARNTGDATAKRAAIAMALAVDQREDDKLGSDERALAGALLEGTPLGDTLWVLEPNGLARAVEISGAPAHRALLERVLDEQLGPEAGGMLLMGRLATADAKGDVEQARALFARLSREPYAELGYAQFASAWNPDRKVKAGAAVPSFEGTQLGAGTAKLRSEQLRGKLVLIELWATWCKPCVDSMDELHALHAEHGGKPKAGRPAFEIVSIAMDDDKAAVEDFRKNWPMPWLHVFAGADRELLYATFETAVLPYAVLVDERGTIITAGADLDIEKIRGAIAGHAASAGP
ncbi:MAG: redoxin domain-containing protein [Deltaproteobacteria bacterium]|nr:redoxin domain-containing protein [Nannocystaceae bacterium]